MAERIQLSANAENISGFVQHSYENVFDFLTFFLDFINLKNPKAYICFSNEVSGKLFVENLLADSGVQFLFDASAHKVLKDYIYMTPVAPNVIPWGSFYESNIQSLQQASEKLSSFESIYKHEEDLGSSHKKHKNELPNPAVVHEDDYFVIKGNSKTWLKDFIINHPDYESELLSFNIVDDVQYQVNEAKLSNELRVSLANHRFKFLFDVIKLSDSKDYVRLFPPWVNKSLIDRLNLTVRSNNCLVSAGYKYIADLRRKDDKQLLQIENFGKGTLKNVTEALKEVCKTYDSDVGLVNQSFRWEILSNAPEEIIDDTNNVQDSNITFEGLGLIDSISLTIQAIDNEQARKVISLRMGIGGETETLQQISEKIGVTRERVRQIETKAKRIFLNRFPIDMELENRLNFIRDGMFLPLTVQGLSTYDDWFKGIEEKPWLIDALLNMFSVGNYKVHEFQGQKIVAPGDRGFIDDSLKLVKDYVKGGIEKRITKSDLLKIVQDFVGVVTPELVDLVFYEICHNCIFTKELDDERLVAYGSGVSSHILAILEESDSPLKVDDLQVICNQNFSLDVELPYIRGRAAEVAYLFAPSTFGTIKHLNLLPDEINQINSEVLEVMLTQAPGRQWHCDELLDLLQDDLPDLLSKLDKYKLAICLSLSNKFQNLGRMVFALPSEGGGVIARRIDFYKFVEAVLERSKGPMHRDEIMGVIKQERGLSEFSQIFNTGRLISVDTATWALQDKHLGITDEKFKQISEEIKNILIGQGAGLSQDELVAKIDNEMLANEFKNNPHLLFSIAAKSKLCKKIDIFIYLSEWGGCRRVTMKQAIFDALIESSQRGSFTAREIWELAEQKYQNKIPRLFINKEITDAGAIYDKENNYWTYKQ